MIPGSGRSPGEGTGHPLQYSCLENPTDRGAWWVAVHGAAKSRTRLSDVAQWRSGGGGIGRPLWSLSHCSPLDSWPSSSIWRRPGPRRDSCLGTQRRGRRCAWYPTSLPVASSPCRCGSCVCAPSLPSPLRAHPAAPSSSVGGGWGQEDRGDPQGLGPGLWGRGRRGARKYPSPGGPQVSKDTSRGTTSL